MLFFAKTAPAEASCRHSNVFVGAYIQRRLSEKKAETVLIVLISIVLDIVKSKFSFKISRKSFQCLPNVKIRVVEYGMLPIRAQAVVKNGQGNGVFVRHDEAPSERIERKSVLATDHRMNISISAGNAFKIHNTKIRHLLVGSAAPVDRLRRPSVREVLLPRQEMFARPSSDGIGPLLIRAQVR